MAISRSSEVNLINPFSTYPPEKPGRSRNSLKRNTSPRVLVTGADGLLGSNLVRELLHRDYVVRVLIHPSSLSLTLEGQPVERHLCDLLCDVSLIQEAVSGCEYVIHCAAITDFWEDPDVTHSVNVLGTQKILDACMREGINRFIYVGSASSFQYGTMDDPGNEEGGFPDVYKRIPYMQTKFKAMKLVKEYVRDKKIDAVIVAPTFMIGGFDSRPSSGETIRRFINNDMKVTSPGGRNFVHVKDAAESTVAALEKGKTGEVYILGGENLSFLEFFSKVAKITRKKSPEWIIPKPLVRVGGFLGSIYEKVSKERMTLNGTIATCSCVQGYYSSEKAKKELGMRNTPIESAIRDSICSLQEYGYIKR